MRNSGSVREITFNEEELTFHFLEDGVSKKEVSLKISYNYIQKNYFKGEYPSESEIEKALNYVEYELTGKKELVCNNEKLFCPDQLFNQMMKIVDREEATKEEVEEVFDKFADCATGEPAPLLGIEYSVEKFSFILVLRAIVYYLGFTHIKLS